MERILIVEDDEDIALLERDYLEVAGFGTELAATGPEGLRMACEGDFSAVVLDVMLPGLSGYEVLRRLRAQSAVPVLLVTARSDDIDQIRGLGLGADDYVTKPFSPSVLVAKVKAAIATAERHRQAASGTVADGGGEARRLTAEGLVVDTGSHEVWARGNLVELTNREYELLAFLLAHKGTVFSRDALYERVWGLDAIGDGATVTVHINRLREKVEADPSHPAIIQTVRGAGYIVRNE